MGPQLFEQAGNVGAFGRDLVDERAELGGVALAIVLSGDSTGAVPQQLTDDRVRHILVERVGEAGSHRVQVEQLVRLVFDLGPRGIVTKPLCDVLRQRWHGAAFWLIGDDKVRAADTAAHLDGL